MPSFSSGASPPQPLQSLQINNQNNNGLIGDGSNNFVNSGNIINSDIVIGINEDELDRLLGRHVSKGALHNSFHSPPECHPNTRTTVRNEIGEWMDESRSEKSPLLWLNGPAAVGKSVIAKTISGFHDQIVATFFFSMSSDKSAATLFPTLAWQLARNIPDTRKHIVAALKQSGSLPMSRIEEQFNLLIIQPLKKITTTGASRPVMMIDGVDECIDERMLVLFLQVLVQAGEGGDMPVRFIICSRPEPRIHTILGTVRDVQDNPTTSRQEPSRSSERVDLLYLLLKILAGFTLFVLPAFQPRATYMPKSLPPSISLPVIIFLVSFAILTFLNMPVSDVLTSADRLHAPTQRSRSFLQETWELYRPIRLSTDKSAASSETCNDLGTLDTICPHSVISTIQIGFSQECKQDIARYLTDKFNEIRQWGGTSPWFQQSDIFHLVEASCGQFLYASTVVRLIDEPHLDLREVLEMARRSSLPTPDLNQLYKAILKRAEDTIRNQAKEGGPNCRKELRFLTDSLTLLVFFAGNEHFFTVRKSYPVIETLLGLESSKLTLKLSKMHSVLRIVPEETIQVHHRSFLEFLQNQERSGEYYIGYSKGLRRICILMNRLGFVYNTVHELRIVQDMVKECYDNFFGRSKIPELLEILHLSTHLSFTVALYMLCVSFLSMPSQVPTLSAILLFVAIIGEYIISLTIYALFFSYSIIVPLFHPFLHSWFFFPDCYLYLYLLCCLLVVLFFT